VEKEQADLVSEKYNLFEEYYRLKDETYNVEKIRASVKSILHNDSLEQKAKRSKSMEK